MAAVKLDDEAQGILRILTQDFSEYAPRCLKIRGKDGTIIPFRMNRAQEYLNQRIEDQLRETGKVRVIGLKGRQQGFSTYTEGRFYWKTSTTAGKRAYILTHLAEATSNLFGMTRRYHELCPEVVKPSPAANSGTRLMFDDLQSEFSVATAGSSGTGRSATAQYFHGSEVAFWPNAADHMAGIGQIVPDAPGTEIILESTANGVGNLFHGMWQDAEAGLSEYLPVFVPWFWQEEYTKQPPVGWEPTGDDAEYQRAFGLSIEQTYWMYQKILTDFRADRSLFDQEYPGSPALAFKRVDGDPLISMDLVLAAVAAEKAGNVEPAGAIIMGVDPAEYGADDTALCIRQGRAVTEMRSWHGRGPMEVVGLVSREADRTLPDIINVDCTGVGSGVADRLIELGYPVNRIHFGERAIQDEIYGIRRDEMWGEMRDWLMDKPAAIPEDTRLMADLTGPQHSYDSSRRLKLESKEQMKKRGLKSPDRADALALTFAIPASSMMASRKARIDHGRKRNWRA